MAERGVNTAPSPLVQHQITTGSSLDGNMS
jgi:hypothetical protein